MNFLKVVCLIACFSFVFAQDHCKCKDPSYESTWGEFIPTSTCHGKCNGIEMGKRECFARKSGDNFSTSYCDAERACHNPDTCEGFWSPWSNIGSCSESCDQLQSRYCYQNKSSLLIRNKYCIGSQGKSEQNRRQLCNHGACNSANANFEKTTTTMQNRIRSSSTTATLQSSGAKKSENQSPKSMNKTESIIENKDEEVSSGEEMIDRNNVGSNSNSVLLIAILGSVGLISLAGLLFGIAFVVLKRKRQLGDLRIRIGPTAEPNRYVTKNDVGDIYATVGPVLPDRPPHREAPSPNANGRVYETTEKHFDSRKINLEAENYLLPDSLESEKPSDDDGHSIYWNIDERR